MKILITTGLASRNVGGPAQYGPRLKEEFEKLGHKAEILLCRSIESALLRILFAALSADRIIALDTFSVGVPSLIAAKLWRKKLVVRIGGDFLWESFVERTGERITLREFNANIPSLSIKEKIIFSLTKMLVRNADVLAFNTEWQKKIWQRRYEFRAEKATVIRNHVPEKNFSPANDNKFLWAGRKIRLKNIELLQGLAQELPIEIVSHLSHLDLQEKLRSCYAVVLPSYSEVCPNFILEAASYGKPFIMTSETGLKEIYNKGGLFIDPFDKKALKQGILEMSEPAQYQQHQKDLESLYRSRPWAEVANDFLKLCQ